MSYTPPPGDALDLALDGSYSPPSGGALALEFAPSPNTVYPASAGAITSFGSPSARNVRQYVVASGLASATAFGATTAQLKTRFVLPLGAGTYGSASPRVWNYNTIVAPTGASYLAFGSARVVPKTAYIYIGRLQEEYFGTPRVYIPPKQYVREAGNISVWALGTQWVSNYLRYVEQRSPYVSPLFGAHRVEFRVRYVIPELWTQIGWGLPTVGRTLQIPLIGWDSSKFGTPDVDWNNVPRPQGIYQAEFGQPWVSYGKRILRQWPTNTLEFGTARVWNSRQYVTQIYDPAYDRDHGVSPWTWVYNRNRTLGAFGWDSSRVSYLLFVLNTGRAIVQAPTAPHTQWGKAMVAYRVRTITPEPDFESMRIGKHLAIWNAAYQIKAIGWKSDAYGKPDPVFSNLQKIKQYFGPDTEFGTAYVDFRYRTLTQILSKDYLKVPYPRVDYGTHYVDVAGIDAGKVSDPVISGPFRKIIKPRYTMQDKYGYPRVWNKTPQLYPGGAEQTEWGTRTWVSNYTRYILQVGCGDSLRFGRTDVRDRKQKLQPRGWLSQLFGVARVRLDGVGLPMLQTVQPAGIGAPNQQVPRPIVRNHPRPIGWDSLLFGQAWVRVQGCSPYWDWADSQFRFGTPTLNATQYVSVPAIRPEAMAAQRVDPHTIWCTFDVTDQAVQNHNNSHWNYVDADQRDPLTGLSLGLPPWFGRAHVFTPGPQYIRLLRQPWEQFPDEAFGDADVQLKRRWISPLGWKSQRFGFPELPSTKRIWAGKLAPTAIGTPTINFVITDYAQYLRMGGYNATLWGSTKVELFNRELHPQGFSGTVWGDNHPMVYHPRHLYPQGHDATLWGVPWASHRIRYVYPEGADNFESYYTPGQFALRMRVRNVNTGTKPTLGDQSSFGAPGVRNNAVYVRPYMIPPPQLCHPHHIVLQ